MNKRPSFQFYPSDWLSDDNVQIMTPAQRGGYIQLICHMWQKDDCSLRNNKQYLKSLSGLSEEELELVLECFQVSDEKITHKRLQKEREKQNKYKQIMSDLGKKGAKIRALNKSKTKGKRSLRLASPAKHYTEVEEGEEDIYNIKNNSLLKKILDECKNHKIVFDSTLKTFLIYQDRYYETDIIKKTQDACVWLTRKNKENPHKFPKVLSISRLSTFLKDCQEKPQPQEEGCIPLN